MPNCAWILLACFSLIGATGTASTQTNGIYRFTEDVKLYPRQMTVNGVPEDDYTGTSVSFTKDEPVAVHFLSSGEIGLALLLADEEQGSIPEQIVISATDFQRAGLRFEAAGSENELYSRYSPYLITQVAGPGGARHRLHYMGAGGCVAYVLRAIGWSGGRSGNGVAITRTLKSRGWTAASCANPARGTVASWSGGRHGMGHTAVWNGSCWAYDVGCGDPGGAYHLLGCVVR
jgi:hypothetical protein